MRIRNIFLIAATLYQLFRFSILFFSIVLALQGSVTGIAVSVSLALAAPALVVVLLLVQLGLPETGNLLPPLRIAAFLQIITAAFLLVHSINAPISLILEIPGALPAIASIILVCDFAFLAFLLLYSRHTEDT